MSKLHLPLRVQVNRYGPFHTIRDANESSLGVDFEKDSADEIVRCVNAHEQLVAALQKACRELESLDAEYTERMREQFGELLASVQS